MDSIKIIKYNKVLVMTEYNKYTGKTETNIYTDIVKVCHNEIKFDIVKKYDSEAKTIIDIGSGRGHELELLATLGITNYIGIEPSETSFKSALNKIKRAKSINNKMKITILRGVGNKLWHNGDAALTDEFRNRMVDIFRNKLSYDSIHMFWTIHYCMDTKEDFYNLFTNINSNLKVGGKLIIFSMNGKMIHKLFQKKNGIITVTADNNTIFELTSYYDHTKNVISAYGNTIGVKFAGAYGLNQEIKENLADSDFIIGFFKHNNYKLIEKTNFLRYANEHNMTCLKDYKKSQKQITVFYDVIILEK